VTEVRPHRIDPRKEVIMKTRAGTQRWAIVADERSARLISVERTPMDSVQVEEHATLENTQTEHQHSRPSPLASKDGHTHAANPHEEETLRKRFAKELAGWVEKQGQKHGIERIDLFAPAKLMGNLRGEWSPDAPVNNQSMHKLEIAHLSAGQLSRHDAIEGLLPPR
jgi:protein required for attachment to host cells